MNREAYLVGEIWDEAPDWLEGDRFDATMNYPLGTAILGFAGGDHLDHATSSRATTRTGGLLHPLDGPAFGRPARGADDDLRPGGDRRRSSTSSAATTRPGR